MQVIVDKHTVTIIKNEIVNEGEYNVQSCNFQFSSDYDGLPKIAIFKTGTVTKQIMLSGNTCITPEEVLQTTGIVGLGVYAYQTDGDNLTLRYSPTPAVFTVEPGSYDEGDTPTPPTPSVIEQLQEEITQNANNITSLENVTATHTTQIGTLQTDVNNIKTEQITQNTNIQTNANDISNIKTEQITQNNNIQANADDITTLQTSLSNETTNRENADINLQQQIDAITSSSDIVDIVGTYAQLQAYDTQHLSNNDVIKVLQDETHENAMTYYRWDKHNSQWIYIGQEAPYYTKSETDTLLQGKANANDVYTKSQIDDTLEDYALKSDLTDFVTEQEVDTKLEDYVETTTYTQGQATQDTNIQNNTDSIEDIESLIEQMPTVSGQGTDLTLQNVLNYRLMKFLPQGVSSQESTTGKNLLDVDADLEFTRSKTLQVNIPAGTYHITNNGTTASDDSNRVTIRFNTNNKTYNLSTSTDYTVTLSSTETTIYLFSHTDYPSSAGVSATIKDLMLSVDGGTYEPYTDGPAPNPSYPYPVKSVTGENSLVINSANLFDKDSGFRLGYINASGTFVSATATACFNQYIPCQPNTNYTIFFNKNISSLGAPIYYTINKTFLSRETAVSSVSKRTFTTPTNCYYMVIQFNADSSTMTQEKIDGLECQLVKGSTAPSTYVEYEEQNYQLSLGNIELNSSPDGTIRDGIYGTPDNWYKREYIGKVVLDGSEIDWSFKANLNNRYCYSTDVINDYLFIPSKIIDGYSDYFKVSGVIGGYAIALNSGVGLWFYGANVSATGRHLYLVIDNITTVNDLKSWLSTHNTTVYYPLAQYTDIPIIDTTLINQLNDIYNNAHSYNGVTNITTTYEDGNEQMYLDIEALAKGGSSTAETDPIFSASASSEITSSDITNWNGKASTTYVDTAIANAITNTLGGSY